MSALLCVGDIHIKPTNTHLIDCLETQLLELIERTHAGVVVLLGDILDTFERIHTQALNRAYSLIHALRARARVFILVGNHDLINNQQFLSTHHWMNALKDWNNVSVVDAVQSLEWKGLRLLFVPYVPVQRFKEALDTFHDWDWMHSDFIFAHQEFKGCKMGAIESVHGDEWLPYAPMIVSGHIHDYQRPQSNLLYIGASVQNSFGDQTDPRVLCIRSKTDRTEYPISLPRKKTVYASIEDLQHLDSSSLHVEDPNLECVRVVVRCDYEKFKTFVKSTRYTELTQSQKCKIVHKPEKVQPKEDITAGGSSEQGVEDVSDFHEAVYAKVLQRRDEYLYVAFRSVVFGDTTLEPCDVLIV